MASLNLRRFADVDTLRRIEPEAFIRFLETHRNFFKGREINIPLTGAGEDLNYRQLAEFFRVPPENTPKELVDALYIVHELADQDGMDAVIEMFEQEGEPLEVPDECDPADLVVHAWLKNTTLVEAAHNQHYISRPNSFLSLSTGDSPIPPFTMPARLEIEALEGKFIKWFDKHKRGKSCKVFFYPQEGVCQILVRHGLPCRREGTVAGGEEGSVFYRPMKHDVLIYNTTSGELKVNCCGKGELTQYLKGFGLLLGGNEGYFKDNARYTLAPIIENREASLAVEGIEELIEIRLKSVEVFQPGEPYKKTKTSSTDIFKLIERGRFSLPENPKALQKATFDVTYADAPEKPRSFSILVPNTTICKRETDRDIMEAWMLNNKFLVS